MSARARASQPHVMQGAQLGETSTHSMILNAAIDVFSRLGFTGARVEDILEAAPVSRRTFYKHYDGKEAVLAALYQEATQRLLMAVMVSGPVTPEDPLEGMWRALDVYFEFHVNNAAFLSVVLQQAARTDSALFPLRRQFRAQLFQLLDAAVAARTGQHHGRLVYVALLAALEGLTLELLSGDMAAADVANARAVIRGLLTRGLRLDAPADGR